MPLPTPERLYLLEAVAYVAERYAVPQSEAEAYLARATRVERKLGLFDEQDKWLYDFELDELRIDWHTGLVETRSVGGGRGPPRRLLVLRQQLDEWGPAAARAAPRVIEHEAEAPRNAETTSSSNLSSDEKKRRSPPGVSVVPLAGSALECPSASEEPSPRHLSEDVERLAEWIFNHRLPQDGEPVPTYERLLLKAQRDRTLKVFPNTAFHAAYHAVFGKTKGRPPAGGKPLKAPYRSRAAREK
jgi:hypothetical protein